MIWKGFLLFLSVLWIPVWGMDIRSDTGPVPETEKEASPLSAEDWRKIAAMSDFACFINRVFHGPDKAQLPDSVVEKLYDVLERDPDSREITALVAADLAELIARKQERLQRLARIAGDHPENLPLNLLAAELLSGKLKDQALAEKNVLQAISLLEKALEKARSRGGENPENLGGAYSMLALLYAARGEFDKADRTVRRGLSVVPGEKRPELLQTAIRVYFDAVNRSSDEKPFLLGWFLESEKERYTRKFNEVSSEFTEILSSPESRLDSERFLAAAAIFGDRGETDLALLIIAAPLVAEPDHPSALRRLAAFYYVSGDFANAARVWRRVLQIRKKPTAFESYMYASSLQRSGDFKAASAAFAAHMKRFPKDVVPLAQYALSCYFAEDYRGAAEIAGKIPSPSPETMYIKALAEERMGDYAASLKTLLQYLSVRKFADEEEKYPIAIQTVLVADKAGRHDVAAAILEPMIDADPENADLLNLLGYLYAEAGINLGTAEKLLLEALELEPENPAVLDSVAWMYFRRERYLDARVYIEKSLAATPQGESPDSVILDHAGDIYNALGNTEKALSCWKMALRVYSEELDPMMVLKKVENAERETPHRK